MSKFFTSLCVSLCVYSIPSLQADAPMETFPESMPEFPMIEAVQTPIEEALPTLAAPTVLEPKVTPKQVVEKTPEVSVNPFTGKIKGRKVRMRLRPDLDSRVIKELSKNELVTIVGEKGNFWAVQPPATTKAYVFRSFVLDNVIEGSKVNVRIEPSMDAPIVAHLTSGDKIENPTISPINSKWLEITPPATTRFYIAKEYVEYAGGPEVKVQRDKKQHSAEQLLDATTLLSKAELRKSFEEIDFDRVVQGYTTIIADFNEFPELVTHSKEALASFQESYLQKRISHLESEPVEDYVVSDVKKASKKGAAAEMPESVAKMTDKMKLWEPLEEALYLSWANVNHNKTKRSYYEEQRLASVEISGIVEPYTTPVKNKPGDFILRDKDIPIGYVYSTQVDLQNLVGKHVKIVATPRPNNNFAFPAYYVLSAE